MSIYGVDCGSHRVKLYTPYSQIMFDRYLMPAKPRPLEALGEHDRWHVNVDGREYFMGNLAEMEGASMAFEKNKSGHKDTLPLIFASIALAERKQPIIKASIVTGLPLIDLQHQKEDFRKLLLGEHVVIINNGLRQWIEVDEVIVFGEGAGAIWNTVLNLDGNVRRQFATWERVIDIGYRTIDFCTLKDMHYVASQSTSIPLGVYHTQMDTYQRVGGIVDTLPEQVVPDQQSLQELAGKIESNINRLWLDRSNIQLAGGGAYLLADYHSKKGSQGQIANPILVRLNELLSDEFLKPIFCQEPSNKFNLEEFIKQGKVVIIRTPTAKVGEKAMKTLMHWLILQVFMIKSLLDGEGAPTWLILNEPHQFLSPGLIHFCKRILTEGAKKKLAPIFLFHHFKQLPNDFVDILLSSSLNWHILKNTNNNVYTRLRTYIEPTFTPDIAMSNTNRFHYIAAWLDSDGEYQTPFMMKAPALVSKRYPTQSNVHLTKQHARIYGTPVDEILSKMK